VCRRTIVCIYEDEKLQAIAHSKPPCDEYLKLNIMDFVKKYLEN